MIMIFGLTIVDVEEKRGIGTVKDEQGRVVRLVAGLQTAGS